MKAPVIITSLINFTALLIYSSFMSDYVSSGNYHTGVLLTTFGLTWIVSTIVSVWISELMEGK